METTKPISPCHRSAAVLASLCLAMPLTAGEPVGDQSLASREQARRSTATVEARELLRKGDQAYNEGRYDQAVEAYAGAVEMIPDAPRSAEIRKAAVERYAQASVERARELSRKGDVAGAKAAVDKVLIESVAPNNPGALQMRARLEDPIRTNPALTAEHAASVDEVRRLLYTAEGAYELGKFDEANATYKKVLRIDSTNSAARRGMEKVAATKTGYYNAAYDQTRAEMLSRVDGAWETETPPIADPMLGPDGPGTGTLPGTSATVKAKLDQILIPRISLDEATLDEALDFLRMRSAEADTFELDPARKGVNFTVNLGPAGSEAATRIRSQRFNLQLSQVPLSQALRYITSVTQTQFSTDEYSVIITPLGSTSDELSARTYKVPPDFLTTLGSGGAAANDDPFAEPTAGGLLTERMSARDALEKQGVSFPDGSSVNYNGATNTLHVVNTSVNHDFISQVVETLSQTEPVMISVRVTMIRTQQTNLEELGFDWLVNPFALSNTVFGSGGTTGNSSGRTGADFVSPVNGTSVTGVPANPDATVNPGLVTNGLRSGDQGITQPSIDGMLNNPTRGTQSSAVAPGILAVTGLFSDGQVQMLMRGLAQKQGTDMLAQPSTVTRSGQQASVEIVREFIYPTEYEPPELPNTTGFGGGASPVTPATPTAFDMKPVGINLEIMPVAGENRRYVDITLASSFSDFDGFINYGSPINSTADGLFGPETVVVTPNEILMPIFSLQRANTQLTVADGATIVIGGLLQDQIQHVEDKVPVLGSIPYVGRLFSSRSKQSTSTAVVFLVHVEMLDPTGRPYRDR